MPRAEEGQKGVTTNLSVGDGSKGFVRVMTANDAVGPGLGLEGTTRE